MSRRYDGHDPGGVGGSPPAGYHVAQAPPQPAGPPFDGRHMLPPSSPQSHHRYNHSFPPPLSRDMQQTNASSYTLNRDLPAPSSSARAGSSMSISSMLGGETLHPRPQTSSITLGSPPQMAVERSRPEYTPYRRAQTPDGSQQAQGQGPRDNQANPAGSLSSFHNAQRTPPEPARQSLPHLRPFQGQSPYAPSSAPNQGDQFRQLRQENNALPPRPSSQPAGYGPPRSHHSFESNSPEGSRRFAFDQGYGHGLANKELGRYGDRDRALAIERDQVERERERGALRKAVTSGSPLAYSPSHQAPPPYLSREAPRTYQYHSPSQQKSPETRHREPSSMMEPGSPSGRYPGYSSVSAQQTPNSIQNGHNNANPGALMHPQQLSQLQQEYELDRRRQNLSQPGPSLGGGSMSVEPLQRRASEDASHLQQQRGFLGINQDLSKKGGRISPLPQAVQGAQAQISGPGEEPGIKSEFGRMFSGIGSGVGSGIRSPGIAMTGSDAQATRSPIGKDGEMTGDGANADSGTLTMRRTSSRGGKRGRKIGDDDSKMSSESGDGRGSPSNVNGRAKRPKHGHHHHHIGPHHHHHHHHKAEDDLTMSSATLSSPLTGLGMTKRSSTPQSAGGSHHHHHHHPHHPHHHYHHNNKAEIARTRTPMVVAAPPFRKATTTVRSQSLLASVALLPRYHLGSMLYAPRLTVSSAPSHLKFGFATTPNPIPRFQGRENCLFMVRVPRFYLLAHNREEITRRRAVWGSEIYTDDSDILAASIHAGWIRGEWGDEVDVSQLDLGKDAGTSAPANSTSKARNPTLESADKGGPMRLDAIPPVPLIPQRNLDLHITIRILPPLQSYGATVQNGMRSRSWGNNHDGMSFKIDKIEFVDEGRAGAEARTGAARRKRLKALADLGAGGMESSILTRLESNQPRLNVATA